MTGRRAMAIAMAGALLGSGCMALQPKYSVNVDMQQGIKVPALGRRLTFDGVYLRYFPKSLTLRPDDRVRFNLRDSGEPHTVTLGTLVDDAVEAIEEAGANADHYDLVDLPAVRKLPRPFTRVGSRGRLVVNRAAADQCFLADRAPPVTPDGGLAACRAPQPHFDGRQLFYNAGRLSAGDTFEMTLAGSIRRGTYSFLCLVHPTAMRGTIEIVGSDDVRPRPGVPKKRAEGERNKPGEQGDAVRGLSGAGNLAGAATAENAVAGVPASGDVGDYLATFGPPDYKVEVGEPLTWNVFGIHSITFNKPDDIERGAFIEGEGRTVINRDAWAPADSPALPSDAAVAERDRKDGSTEVDAGTWDGRGFHSSGVMDSPTSGALNYTLTFEQPGTYEYTCLVHRTMKGKVVVSRKGSDDGP